LVEQIFGPAEDAHQPLRPSRPSGLVSQEILAIEVDVSLTGERATQVLEPLHDMRGLPTVIRADNGPELRGRVLDQWAYDHGVRLQFIEPSKPLRMRTSKVSTHACARNVSMSMSSFRSTTRGARLKNGVSNIIASARIRASDI
jgi:hypothetical protein